MKFVVLPVFVLTGLVVWRYRKSRNATYKPGDSIQIVPEPCRAL